jgi:hypothetical protein
MDAYVNRNMRPNDIIFINSLIVFVISWLLLVIITATAVDDIFSTVYTIPPFYISLMILIGSSVIYQTRSFSVSEGSIWILLNLIYIGFGILFFR